MNSRTPLKSTKVLQYESLDSRRSEQHIGDDRNSSASGPTEHQFRHLTETIAPKLDKIRKNVLTMQRMIRQLKTLPGSLHLKPQFHQIMTSTHQLISDTSDQLKKMEQYKERHFKIQRKRLVDEFSSFLEEFQTVQRNAIELEKNAMYKARANRAMDVTSSDEGSSPKEFLDRKASYQQQQQLLQDERDLAVLEQQERAIRELEANVVGVHQIFQTLHGIAHEQREIVDTIETSVDDTVVVVEKGAQAIQQGAAYQNKIRKTLIIVGLLAIVLVIILILVLTHK